MLSLWSLELEGASWTDAPVIQSIVESFSSWYGIGGGGGGGG